MNRNFALEFVRVTEMAAIAAARWMGRGDEKSADQAAVDAMRQTLDSVEFNGRVVIGEGERDEAPMLYIGEQVGSGGPELDLALDPLEGTTICARGGVNAISVIAVAQRGHFLHAPDTYMDKIAVGPEASGVIDLDKSPTENLEAIADIKKKPVQELTAVILDRPRHEDLIEEVRKAGARIWLIGDGDVSAAIACCDSKKTGVDILFGTGGAPEGVITAAALRCLGGDFQGRLNFRNENEKKRATQMGIKDLEKLYRIDELASGPVMFSATGVTPGTFLQGVYFTGNQARTHSVCMRSRSGTVREITAHHRFDLKPEPVFQS
jgi:fructose-1,6-bisphosphatase class II